ncbi:MAG: hypothetical protein ACI902_002354 [Psychroserpens sp.]|jgi:hypothetical protein
MNANLQNGSIMFDPMYYNFVTFMTKVIPIKMILNIPLNYP